MRRDRSPIAIALLVVALAANSTGCWSRQSGPPVGDLGTASQSGKGSSVLLRVNEAGIPWANGELGPEIRREVLERSGFREVYYPVEPPNPPTTVIEIVALGALDEALIWGTIATALNVVLPVLAPLLPYFEDYEAKVDVRVFEEGNLVGSFEVESSARVVHAILASPQGYVPEARERVTKDLSRRIAAGLEELDRG